MLDKIISSKARLAILSLIFANQGKNFYAQEIVNKTGLDPANVKKELDNLVSGGFLIAKKEKGKKVFELNKKNEFYEGLKIVFEKYQKSENQEGWIIIEEMPEYHPMIASDAWNTGIANDFLKKMGIKGRLTQLITVYNNGLCAFLAMQREFNDVAQETVNKLIENPVWGRKYIEELVLAENRFKKDNKEASRKNFGALSKKELLDFFDTYYTSYIDLHAYHWIQSLTDFNENYLSKYLMRYLGTKIGKSGHSLGEIFSVLTTPIKEGGSTKEYKNLLEILKYIQKNKKLTKYICDTEARIIIKELASVDKNLDRILEEHTEKYGSLGYGSLGPGWKKDYFLGILASLVRQKADPKKMLEKTDEDKQKLKNKQKILEKELKIDKKFREIFEVTRDIVFTKGTRKDAMFEFFSIIDNFYREVGRRYYLSIKQIHFMYPHEFRPLLLEDRFSAEKLNERFKFSIYHSIGDYKDDEILEGERAKKFLATQKIVREEIKDTKLLIGDCASPGRARGEVKIVNIVADIAKVNEGDIMVSIATTPDLLPAMRKSSAIVTDVGGITCHAAIVSRELGIPCVIGTRFATKILKDGFIVDVDATHGKVSIIKKK